MNYTKYISLVILIYSTTLFAQKEASQWYFGDSAAIDFNNSTPIPLNNSAMDALEGCSSISDADGNLLFYTDGITVWNSNHDTMPNGKGLKGDPSSSQSALVVPQPGSNSIYYIFSVGAFRPIGAFPDSNMFNYSEVDMSLAGGLGDVTANKNVSLLKLTPEKVAATLHDNGQDVWVTTHGLGNDEFYSFLVTSSGVDTIPIISRVGAVTEPLSIFGCSKFSPHGSYLAIANALNSPSTRRVELFKFNNATGEVTETVFLDSTIKAYGVEFSPSARFLYIASSSIDSINKLIYQYDLLAPDIIASKTVVGRITNPLLVNSQFGSLQLGIDGKIYAAIFNSDSLGVIHNPNNLGLDCNYRSDFYLGGNISKFGLPPFIANFFSSDDASYTYSLTDFCLTDTNALPNITGSIEGTFTINNGGVINSSTGEIDLLASGVGNYQISYTVGASTSLFDITISDCSSPEIPNVFSPNGDQMNELFAISAIGGIRAENFVNIEIFNRWGQLLFETSNLAEGWDGTTNNGSEVSEGTYYYVLTTVDQVFKGALSLMR